MMDVWKCTGLLSGGLCVPISLIQKTVMLPVESSDTTGWTTFLLKSKSPEV